MNILEVKKKGYTIGLGRRMYIISVKNFSQIQM